MSENASREFSSWKEIASRLGVSVRTAQLWEKERGLPVRRVPGKRGRVYLRADELENWLATATSEADVPAGGPHDSHGARSWLPFGVLAAAVAGLAVAAIAAAIGRGAADPGVPPVRMAFGDDVLIALDALEGELWRLPVPGLREEPYRNGGDRWAPRIEDIDGDGTAEVLVTILFEDTSRSNELLCLSANGRERWRFAPGGTVSTATERFEETYLIAATELVRLSDGSRGIVYSAHHAVFHPNRIGLLTADGELAGEYWHPGHIGSHPAGLLAWDLDGDGDDELLAGGISNAREEATLVVLDPEAMSGGAAAGPEYRFEGLAPGVEIATLFFPRSGLNRQDDRFNAARSLRMGQGSLYVGVQEMLADPGDAIVVYELDASDLSLLQLTPADSFLVRHEQALAAGEVADSVEEELARLERLFREADAGR